MEFHRVKSGQAVEIQDLLYFHFSLLEVNLEVTVLDYDRIGGSDPIGKVLLGYNRKKLEKKHWTEMVDNPRRPIIHWHVLKVRHSSHFQSC